MGYVMGGAAMERALPAAVLARTRAAAARATTRARRHGASNNCTAQLSGTRKMGRAPRTGTVAGARFSWTVSVAAQCGTAKNQGMKLPATPQVTPRSGLLTGKSSRTESRTLAHGTAGLA